MKPKYRLLQIHAQEFFHTEACIFGNRAGLLALAWAAIKAALSGKPSVFSAFPSDGEGYAIAVARSGDERQLDVFKSHYRDESASGPGEVWPARFPGVLAALKSFNAKRRKPGKP